ncbi:uncharacterized protein LOC110824753 [Carica papaya]|uniref:uncharacterized protein LOC110824753 n=1 Tax=Carica papaya TaxID=3649 RepID=UPI000B8CD0F5|nr:uncharacterized protein LOC110824753 [Carica papaya]
MSHGYNTSPIFLYQTHKFFPSHINQVALPHFHLKLLPWFHPKSLLKPHKSGFPIYPSCSVKNSFIWTATEIAEAVQGRILRWGPPGSVCTDTRNLESTQWFFAIKGEKFDAHQFVTPELSQRGCVGVIGNRVCKNWDKGFVQINGDTLVSLINMANYAREKFLGTLIGVTGCTGKTTTKAMIALCLEGLDEVYQSHGNWNNRIGVALSLIGLPRSTRVAILEMGMSRKGEILELAKMGRPNVRVILNVGASHLENFGSLEEVAMAKGEILEEAMPGDVVVLNADDPLVMGLHVPRGVKK